MITAKIFRHGGSQAVRLPKAFRFDSSEVQIEKRGDDVVLTPLPAARFRTFAEIARHLAEKFPEAGEFPAAPAGEARAGYCRILTRRLRETFVSPRYQHVHSRAAQSGRPWKIARPGAHWYPGYCCGRALDRGEEESADPSATGRATGGVSESLPTR
ncbi:MAG: AbrB/MazE/SpoVT family DNA-binding domain-containing protein [Opitutaceae bacterium]|nr:AbrB/MazE/SpoVT family DNA-binding domain-containing protein [Opitutaceae bacterium]